VINPEITVARRRAGQRLRRRLSIPRKQRDACPAAHGERSARSNEKARRRTEPKDYSAQRLQHEFDHLDGVLFFDRMRSLDADLLEEYGRTDKRMTNLTFPVGAELRVSAKGGPIGPPLPHDYNDKDTMTILVTGGGRGIGAPSRWHSPEPGATVAVRDGRSRSSTRRAREIER